MNILEELNLKIPIQKKRKEVLVVRPDIYNKILAEAKETTTFKKIEGMNIGYYNFFQIENAPTLKEPYKFMTRKEYDEWKQQEIAKKIFGVW